MKLCLLRTSSSVEETSNLPEGRSTKPAQRITQSLGNRTYKTTTTWQLSRQQREIERDRARTLDK